MKNLLKKLQKEKLITSFEIAENVKNKKIKTYKCFYTNPNENENKNLKISTLNNLNFEIEDYGLIIFCSDKQDLENKLQLFFEFRKKPLLEDLRKLAIAEMIIPKFEELSYKETEMYECEFNCNKKFKISRTDVEYFIEFSMFCKTINKKNLNEEIAAIILKGMSTGWNPILMIKL